MIARRNVIIVGFDNLFHFSAKFTGAVVGSDDTHFVSLL